MSERIVDFPSTLSCSSELDDNLGTTGLRLMLQSYVLLQAQNDIIICESVDVEGQTPGSVSQAFNSMHQ